MQYNAFNNNKKYIKPREIEKEELRFLNLLEQHDTLYLYFHVATNTNMAYLT